MGKQICTRCVMDNYSDKSIIFDKHGHCNYCTDALSRIDNEYFSNDFGRRKLESIFSRIKNDCKDDKYDCMVGLSGGVDSSYIIYLGFKYNLRMLAVHVDDGFDTDIATINVNNLCKKANCDLIIVKPNMDEYKDLTKSLFLARVPGLALVQDSVLLAALNDTAKKYNMKYLLSGANFSLESILERSNGTNICDKTNILAIHKQFGNVKINDTRFISFYEKYIYNKYFSKVKKILPLNYIDYNLENALNDLKKFSNYNYYGGKHYESILTRFLQCYYLPKKYGFDKRKSHYSSMIISNQMTRDEALEELKKPCYINEELKNYDFDFIANYLGMSMEQFDELLKEEPKQQDDYKVSFINNFASIARKFRKYLGN